MGGQGLRPARVRLDAIVFDAGTQVRAAISEETVAEYAEAMQEGATFPPVMLFCDSARYYMADGFHRGLAAKRIGAVDIPAVITNGTREDALWHALGANREHGRRLTGDDKRKAITLALQAWPERSGRQIAQQIGCGLSYLQRVKDEVTPRGHLARVTGKDGKSYPARRSTPPPEIQPPPSDSGKLNKSGEATRKRYEQIRELAATGHSLSQIADAVGLGEESCRHIVAKERIDVPAQRALGRVHRHDANRILNQIVMDASNLVADFSLVALSELDRDRLPEWIGELEGASRALRALIRKLQEERGKHVEAA